MLLQLSIISVFGDLFARLPSTRALNQVGEIVKGSVVSWIAKLGYTAKILITINGTEHIILFTNHVDSILLFENLPVHLQLCCKFEVLKMLDSG